MDPVRAAEIDHEMEQDALQKQKDLFVNSGRFDECVIAKYHEYLEDPLRMWEAIGPDGFQAPFPRAKAIVYHLQNRAALEIHEAQLACAIKDLDYATFGKLQIDHAKAHLLDEAYRYVELNWRDYE